MGKPDLSNGKQRADPLLCSPNCGSRRSRTPPSAVPAFSCL